MNLLQDETLENQEEGDNLNKRKRGRHKSITTKIENLKEVLRKQEFHSIVSQNGEIATPSSEIYQQISDAMELINKMQPKYIYTILLENRYNVFSELAEYLKIEPPLKDFSFNDSSILNTSENAFEFRLNVTEIWPSMRPDTNLHHFRDRDRIVRKLKKKSWTHVLYEDIINITNIPCALAFNNSRITESGIFVTVEASCSECFCKFKGEIIDEPKEGEKAIMMDCRITDFNKLVAHEKKRNLQGKLRTAVGNVLIDKSLFPSQQRKNEAHRLIQTVGDESPPNLYKTTVLSKAKQERLNEKLGIVCSNPIENLSILKYDNKYNGAIRNIGKDPVFVHYWTKEQQLIYEKFSNKMYFDGTGSLVKKIKLPNNNLCPHIFLYQGLVDVNGVSVPVIQMLSSSHSTVAIQNWLFEFRRIGCIENKNYPFPQEIITDFDKALLGAVARVFVEVKSLIYYLYMCFEIIQGSDLEMPHCIIRLDVCHYTKMVAYWNCYPKRQPGVKAIYLRAMCILRRQENFNEFETMVIHILTLALCKSGNNGSYAATSKEFLKLKIRGVKDPTAESILKSENENSGCAEEKNMILDEAEEAFINSTSLGKWIDNIYDEVQKKAENEKTTNDDEVNAYYLPQFAKKFKNLLVYFPLFTEIMSKEVGFGTLNPSSSAIESYFNDLKNRVFRLAGLPLRLDKFVILHLQDIEKKLKSAATGALTITETGEIEAVLKKSVSSNKRKQNNELTKVPVPAKKNRIDKSIKKTIHDNASVAELANEHNWRNKIKKVHITKEDIHVNDEESDEGNVSTFSEDCEQNKVQIVKEEEDSVDDFIQKDVSNFKELQVCLKETNKKKKGAQYGEYCPHFEPSVNYYTWLPILPNGSICKNVREHQLITVVSNSCALDSLVHVISMLIMNNEFYNEQISEFESDIFSLAKIFIKKKLGAEVFKERARVLRNSSATIKEVKQYDKKIKTGKSVISIVTINAVCNLTELTTNLFSATPSYTVEYTCTICKKIQKDDFIIGHIDLQVIYNSGIVNLLEALQIPPRKDKICCKEKKKMTIYYGPHLLISVEVGKRNDTRICDILKIINLGQKTEYKIAGFIGYSGSYNPEIPGHYKAYVLVNQTWLLYDDLSSSKQPEKIFDNEKVVDPHVLIYSKEATNKQN